MVRYRAFEHGCAKDGYFARQVTETDRNGRLDCRLSGLANWATDTGNSLTRPVMEGVAGIDREAYLPAYDAKTLLRQAAARAPEVD
jgi:glycerol-3-phosphate dehydrogenase subunit C